MNKDIMFLKAPKGESEREDEYNESASKICGLNPYSIPVIDFNFLNTDALVEAIKSIECFSAVIFTSPRAVEGFNMAINKMGGMEKLNALKEVQIFVVGKATSKAVSKLSLNSEGKDSGSAEKLAKYILEQEFCDVFGKTVLFIHGNLARDTLPSLLKTAGVKMQSICVYETVAHPLFLDSFNSHLKINNNPEFIVFFSPSGAEFYLKSIREMTSGLNGVKIVAIGKTTADWLKQSNCRVDGVADQPNPESLCQCIKKIIEENC